MVQGAKMNRFSVFIFVLLAILLTWSLLSPEFQRQEAEINWMMRNTKGSD